MSKEKSSDNKDEPKKPKAPRIHMMGGMPWPVERAYYDPKQNCVIDVVRIDKVVQNKKGEDVPVTTFRSVYCDNVELQKKYRVDPNVKKEIIEDVE